MRTVKIISIFLGASMFMFGVLKFVNPFKVWYSVQVANSGLGEISYWMGITGEITVGVILLGSLVFRKKLSPSNFKLAIGGSSLIIIVMMSTGVWVHLQPAVPAEVLPLKIKPPYIPGFFLLLALTNFIVTLKFLDPRKDLKSNNAQR